MEFNKSGVVLLGLWSARVTGQLVNSAGFWASLAEILIQQALGGLRNLHSNPETPVVLIHWPRICSGVSEVSE